MQLFSDQTGEELQQIPCRGPLPWASLGSLDAGLSSHGYHSSSGQTSQTSLTSPRILNVEKVRENVNVKIQTAGGFEWK